MRSARKTILLLTPFLVATLTYLLVEVYIHEKSNMVLTSTVTHISAGGTCKFRMLYYDSLSVEYPNKTLEKNIEQIAKQYKGCVDMYIGSQAGIRPLLNLSSYDIIVIRAHGGLWGNKGFYIATGLNAKGPYDVPLDFLKELYEKGAVEAGSPAIFSRSGLITGRSYIVVGAAFFNNTLLKNNSIIIIASCDSGVDTKFIKVFFSKGASAYIGWYGQVTPNDIDRTLPVIVKFAIVYRNMPCKLVENIMRTVITASDTGAYIVGFCKR